MPAIANNNPAVTRLKKAGQCQSLRHRWLVRGFSFRQCVEDFRGRSASAMLFDDLAEEDDTLPVDQESRWIGRLVWCVPSEPVHIGELVALIYTRSKFSGSFLSAKNSFAFAPRSWGGPG